MHKTPASSTRNSAIARRHSGISSLALLAGLAGAALTGATLGAPTAFASPVVLPGGGVLSNAAGSISTSGTTEAVTIDAKNPGEPVVINWGGGYDVGTGGTIAYGPGSGGPTSGTIVNVDNSGSVSVIDGTVSSPDYAQVMVNPNGISVGSTAVLPASTELAAGTLVGRGSNLSITADTAPVTIARGASFVTLSGAQASPIPVTAASGDTLPDTVGMSPVSVTVPANLSSSFTLQPGQTGSYYFIGPVTSAGVSAPSNVSITGPSGAMTGSLSLQEPISGSNTSMPTGTMSVSNLSVDGTLTIDSGQGINLSGSIKSTGGMTVSAHAYSAPLITAAPGAKPGALLTLAPNVIVTSNTSVNLEGDSVSLGGAVLTTAPNFAITSNHSLAPLTPVSVTDSADNASVQVGAPTVGNLTLAATGTNGFATIYANTLNNSAIVGNAVQIMPATYEKRAPDFKPLVLDGFKATTTSLSISGAYGVTLENVTQVLPAGTSSGIVDISGADLSGIYPASTNTSNDVSISTSSFQTGSGGAIDVYAGMPGFFGQPIPGKVTIDNSTLSANDIGAVTYDGGLVDIGKGSVLNAGTDCGNCSTFIRGKTVNYQAGNLETAGKENMVQASTVTGTANASPRVAAFNSTIPANIELIATGGTVDLGGALRAGDTPPPPVVTHPAPPGGTPTPPPATTHDGGGATIPPVTTHNGGGDTTAPVTAPVKTGKTTPKPTATATTVHVFDTVAPSTRPATIIVVSHGSTDTISTEQTTTRSGTAGTTPAQTTGSVTIAGAGGTTLSGGSAAVSGDGAGTVTVEDHTGPAPVHDDVGGTTGAKGHKHSG